MNADQFLAGGLDLVSARRAGLTGYTFSVSLWNIVSKLCQLTKLDDYWKKKITMMSCNTQIFPSLATVCNSLITQVSQQKVLNCSLVYLQSEICSA